jgi:hypothetical protein
VYKSVRVCDQNVALRFYMTSSQSSELELVTIDQAQQIVRRAHLAGHDQSIVKSLNQIENKGYRQVHLDSRSGMSKNMISDLLVIPLDIRPIFWIWAPLLPQVIHRAHALVS